MKAAIAAAAAAASIACLMSGCSSGESPQEPTTSTTVKKVVSTVLDVTLPTGTTISSHSDGVEIWQTPGSRGEAVSALKPQLPVGRELDGATWCSEQADPKTGSLDWRWAGPAGSIDVNFGSDGSVRMERIAGAAVCKP